MSHKSAFPTRDFFVDADGTGLIQGLYSAGSTIVAGGAGAVNIASIENPAASGRRLCLRRLGWSCDPGAGAFTGRVMLERTVALPSAGAAATIARRGTDESVPVGIVRTSPTVVASAGVYRMDFSCAGDSNSSLFTLDGLIVLLANQAMVVHSPDPSTTQEFVVFFEWFETIP